MKTITNTSERLSIFLTCLIGVFFISQTSVDPRTSTSSGSNTSTGTEGDRTATISCSNPRYLPGRDEDVDRRKMVANNCAPFAQRSTPPAQIPCGQNAVLCDEFVKNITGIMEPIADNSNARSSQPQGQFIGKKSKVTRNWMETNYLGTVPVNFRLYFGKDGQEYGMVVVPVDVNCNEEEQKARWISITDSKTVDTPDPQSKDKCLLWQCVKDYQIAMDQEVGVGEYVQSWTYNSAVLKELLRVKDRSGNIQDATKFHIEYGVIEGDGAYGGEVDELDPVFKVIYDGVTTGELFSEYADWAQPCPVLCPGNRYFGTGTTCSSVANAVGSTN